MKTQMYTGGHPRTNPLADLAERIVIHWIEAVQTPPANVQYLVGRYRDLQFYNYVEEDSEPTDRLMDAIYSDLTARAEAYCWAEMVSQFVVQQPKAILPLQTQWDAAIAQWQGGRA